MTRTSPDDYTDAEFVMRGVRERKPQMQLDQKSILGAVGILLGEQIKAREQAVAELKATIAALQNRIEQLEQRPGRALRAVGE
jgi:uncharacterized protein YhaN